MRYIAAMRLLQSAGPYKPYKVAGSSVGGLVAFEVASQLAASGDRTANRVVLVGPELPNSQHTGPTLDEASERFVDELHLGIHIDDLISRNAAEGASSEGDDLTNLLHHIGMSSDGFDAADLMAAFVVFASGACAAMTHMLTVTRVKVSVATTT